MTLWIFAKKIFNHLFTRYLRFLCQGPLNFFQCLFIVLYIHFLFLLFSSTVLYASIVHLHPGYCDDNTVYTATSQVICFTAGMCSSCAVWQSSPVQAGPTGRCQWWNLSPHGHVDKTRLCNPETNIAIRICLLVVGNAEIKLYLMSSFYKQYE